MKICILATNEKIGLVRERAKQIERFASPHMALAIPLSESGDVPPTHWFCTFNASDEAYQQIKSLQEFSEIVESEPRPFLEEKNLKVISQKKMIAAKREA